MTYKPKFSLEVFPPKRTSPIGTIYDTLDGLKGLDPDFISVTYGTGKLQDRTATARIANTIRSEYGIDAVAHLTARYLDYDAVDEALEMFDNAGVSGVLALRGDVIAGQEAAGVFEHASDLVSYIRSKRPDLPILGACYPEKHPEAESLQADIDNLKRKVDAGVTYLISQLFYDNEDFLRFRDLARAAGINVPIEAGVMPVANASQVKRMTSLCSSRITSQVSAMMDRWGSNAECLRDAGSIFASQQINDLIAEGVDGIHLYTMNHPGIARRIWANVKPLFTKIG